MAVKNISQRVARLHGTARSGGAALVLRKIYDRLLSSRARAYRRAKAAEDRNFDGATGLDTGGIQHPYRLATIGTNVGSATSHIASPPDQFAAAMEAVDLPLADCCFVDLGSGKGRAVILALDLPFRRVVGVEFATPLCDIARANLDRLGVRHGPGERVEIVNGDATAFDYPAGPLLLFLYHPFDPPVLTHVARASLAAWRAQPRPLRVVYLNPVHLQDWLDSGWLLRVRDGMHAVLAPPEG